MASLFESLPPEMVQKCVEFLPFDKLIERGAWAWEAHSRRRGIDGDRSLKSVSKAVCAAVRRALTKGRWRPIRYVAEQGLAVCAAGDLGWPLSNRRGEGAFAEPPPAAACAIFREAWALDPALVIRLICDWDTAHFFLPGGSHLDRERADQGVYQGRFLWIVEPSAAGLSRIVAALEGTCLIQFSINVPHYYPATVPSKLPFFPFPMLHAWNWALEIAAGLAEDPNKAFDAGGSPISLESVVGQDLVHSEAGPLVGRGLGTWSDPKLAARFARKFHVRYGYSSGYANEMEMYFGGAALWSANWVNRTKAGAFMAEMGRIWNAHWSDPDE